MNSLDLAEIQLRFTELRNEAGKIVDVNEKIQRLHYLEHEELRSVNVAEVWTTIRKIRNSGLIDRSYLSSGDFGPENLIKQYLVNETEVAFFDEDGLIVIKRAIFDLASR